MGFFVTLRGYFIDDNERFMLLHDTGGLSQSIADALAQRIICGELAGGCPYAQKNCQLVLHALSREH